MILDDGIVLVWFVLVGCSLAYLACDSFVRRNPG